MKLQSLILAFAVVQALPVSHDFGDTINFFLKAIEGPATVTNYGEETMHCIKTGDVVECLVVDSAEIKDLEGNPDDLVNFEEKGWNFRAHVKRDDDLDEMFKRDCGSKCYCELPNMNCNPKIGAVAGTTI